eukprot:scaffold86331_cov33-Phaeocystis_antarctica.AAC.1
MAAPGLAPRRAAPPSPAAAAAFDLGLHQQQRLPDFEQVQQVPRAACEVGPNPNRRAAWYEDGSGHGGGRGSGCGSAPHVGWRAPHSNGAADGRARAGGASGAGGAGAGGSPHRASPHRPRTADSGAAARAGKRGSPAA